MLDSEVSGHRGQQSLLRGSPGGSQVPRCRAQQGISTLFPSRPSRGQSPDPSCGPEGPACLGPASPQAPQWPVGPTGLLPVGSWLALEHVQNPPPLGSSCFLPSRPGPPLLASVGLGSPGTLQGLVPDPSSPPLRSAHGTHPWTRCSAGSVGLPDWSPPAPGTGSLRGGGQLLVLSACEPSPWHRAWHRGRSTR